MRLAYVDSCIWIALIDTQHRSDALAHLPDHRYLHSEH